RKARTSSPCGVSIPISTSPGSLACSAIRDWSWVSPGNESSTRHRLSTRPASSIRQTSCHFSDQSIPTKTIGNLLAHDTVCRAVRRSAHDLIDRCSRHDIPPVVTSPRQAMAARSFDRARGPRANSGLDHRWLGGKGTMAGLSIESRIVQPFPPDPPSPPCDDYLSTLPRPPANRSHPPSYGHWPTFIPPSLPVSAPSSPPR